MSLLKRQTDEEKAAARERKEGEKAAERQRKEEEQAERAAAEVRALAEYQAFVSTLPKWEYRVITESTLAGLGQREVQRQFS